MWGVIAYGAFLVGSYIYHRLTDKQPPLPKPVDRIEVPRIEDGSVPPLIYGRCRVRAPLLAWCGQPVADEIVDGVFKYSMDFFMVLGIPFSQSLTSVWQIWVGENYLNVPGGLKKTHNVGGLNPWIETNVQDPTKDQRGDIGGFLEVFDGRPTQLLRDSVSPYTTVSVAGTEMVDAGLLPEQIPGYRGFVSVFHYGGVFGAHWALGNSAELGSYQYEVASYPAVSDALNVGLEANPAEVLIDLITGRFGKLGLDTGQIHAPSFTNARIRLQEEGNGYSRAIDSATDLAQIIREIEEQIDGIIYEDPRDGLIHIKLIRPDYDLGALPHITVSNCERLENFAAGGWESAINKIRVVYTNRDDSYRDGSATAQNQAMASTQDGEVNEEILHYPGVCTFALASQIAARELSARSRPIAKCRAIVNRDFEGVMPGDPVKLTWPEYGVDGRVFRVAAVSRGTLANRRIALELIEDFYFSWRGQLVSHDPGNPGDLHPFEPA